VTAQMDLFADYAPLVGAGAARPVLRDYQLDVLDRLRARIREGRRRLILQAPTGAGKTHVIAELTRCAVLKGKRVLVLAHRRRLIHQASERLEMFNVPHGVIMAGERANGDQPVQVASRDTLLSRSLHNSWVGFPPADVVVIDEAHNMDPIALDDGTDVYQQILRHYPQAVVVGPTATPARPDGTGLGEFWQALECTVGVEQLVREGHLVPVVCYAPAGACQSRYGARPRGMMGDVVGNWEKHAAGLPTVVFAAKRDAARAVCAQFLSAGIPAGYMDARTPDGEREEILGGVASGSVLVVCQVGLMVEGVDVPALACCILLRRAGSVVLYRQAVGRILRPHPGKHRGVLLDHAGAVFQHGMPDEDTEWSLDAADSLDRRQKARRKPKRPILCPTCGGLFSGSVTCPYCGCTLPRRLRPPALTRPGLLVEVDHRKKRYEDHEAMQKLWSACLFQAAALGYAAGWAAHRFKSRVGRFPPENLEPMPRGVNWKRKVAEMYPQFGRRSDAV